MTIKEIWECRRKICIEAGVKYGRESWESASVESKKDFSIFIATIAAVLTASQDSREPLELIDDQGYPPWDSIDTESR